MALSASDRFTLSIRHREAYEWGSDYVATIAYETWLDRGSPET